jgi:hypothetical protein
MAASRGESLHRRPWAVFYYLVSCCLFDTFPISILYSTVMKMGQRQKGPNYVLKKIIKVPLSIKYQSATTFLAELHEVQIRLYYVECRAGGRAGIEIRVPILCNQLLLQFLIQGFQTL